MFETLAVSSPKRDAKSLTGWEVFFPYYAGYPTSFAKRILQTSNLPLRATVLDPWNGSGTTLDAASQLGYLGVGFDLNPVMVVIARARMISPSESDSLQPLCKKLLDASKCKIEMTANDPLFGWFDKQTARVIRSIERSICQQLVGRMTLSSGRTNLDYLSSIAATYYVALFSVCREAVKPFQSSNPTWLRKLRADDEPIAVTPGRIRRAFTDKIQLMADALASRKKPYDITPAEVLLADSTKLALPPASVDAVLTSPPYCTRIDYTAATRVELAVLSALIAVDPSELSRRMLGSTRVPVSKLEHQKTWGKTCNLFLRRVKSHPSKASSGYYLQTHIDYFDKLTRSIAAISSAMKSGSPAILVVQDSYYKDIHNDLPTIVSEIASSHGLELLRKDSFHLKRSMSGINGKAKAYQRPLGATESVLCFRKD